MKRPKLRKASKRLTCAKRFKIQKKVREHNRKERRDAKKKGVSKRVKKDPGVPSSAPFKEEVLREAEQRRLQLEEQKEKQRLLKIEARAKKRKLEKENAANEPTATKEPKAAKEPKAPREPNAKKARQAEAAERRLEKQKEKSTKHFMCAELNKVINASDVIIEVLDARDPLGCRCPEVEQAVLSKNKKLIFVLSRIDLVPRQHVDRWLQHLQKECPVVVFKASTRLQHKVEQSKRRRIEPSNDIIMSSKAGTCFGGQCLTDLLSGYADTVKGEDILKVGVVGFPSVGKSSVINGVKGAMVCMAGVQRGMTKNLQEVHIAKNVKLLDCPAIVASPSNPPAAMALRSLQVEDGEQNVLEAVRTLLKQCDKTQVLLQYNVPNYRNSIEFLTLFAKKRSFQRRDGTPDTEKAAVTFLSDWTGPKMSYYCKIRNESGPPAYMTEEVLVQMKEVWDLKKLQKGNEETLRVVRFPNQVNGVSFMCTEPTSGLLSISDALIPAVQQDDQPDQTVVDTEDVTDEPGQTKESPKRTETRVHFQAPEVDVIVPTETSDDAYDFNTDFK